MKKICAGVLALLLLLTAASSAAADITPEQYASATKAFTEYFADSGVVGAGILVNQGGKRIFECYYGYGSMTFERAVDAATVYKVASVSKLISAIGLMRLYDQGLVSLDAPLTSESGRPITNPFHPGVPVTLRQVMSHTSSIKADANFYGYIPWDMIDIVDNGVFSRAMPGERFEYSNLNGGMIGSVIELVTGQNFNRYMTDTVFVPLGINASFAAHLLPDSTTISNTYEADRRLLRSASQYLEDSWGYDQSCAPFWHYNISLGSCFISLAGLETIGRVLAGMGEVDGVRILSEETVRLMMADQAAIPGSGITASSPYGLGVCRDQVGDYMWYGHQGRIEGLLVDVFAEPETQTVVVLVMNGIGGTNGKEVSDRMEGTLSYVEAWMQRPGY